METLIRFEQVSVSFGSNQVFTDLSFDFRSATTYYITGANGCGKSVLLKLAVGLLEPDSGEITLNPALRLSKHRYPLDVGAILDRPGFIADLSGFENLSYLASFRKILTPEQIREVMGRVGLDPGHKKPVKSYSLGMKQRLAIAQAIMERPRALLLDEAFNALDESGKDMLREVIAEYQARSALIILTSHTESEVGELADETYHLEQSQLRRHSS